MTALVHAVETPEHPGWPTWWVSALNLLDAGWRDCHLLADPKAATMYYAALRHFEPADVFSAIERLSSRLEMLPHQSAIAAEVRAILDERGRRSVPAIAAPKPPSNAMEVGFRRFVDDELYRLRDEAPKHPDGWLDAEVSLLRERCRQVFGRMAELFPDQAPPVPPPDLAPEPGEITAASVAERWERGERDGSMDPDLWTDEFKAEVRAEIVKIRAARSGAA